MAEHREPTAPSVARKDEFYWLHGSTGWTVGQKNGAEWLYRGIWCPDDDNLALWGVQIGPRIEEPSAPPTGLVELRERSNTDPQPTITSATPPSPPAVVDYTERARGLAKFLWELWERSNAAPHLTIKDGAHHIKLALSAVASEHQAEIEALKHDIVRYQAIASSEAAGHSEALAKCQEQRHRAQDAEAANMALPARLPEPEMREAIKRALEPYLHDAITRQAREDAAAAVIAVITEKLNG